MPGSDGRQGVKNALGGIVDVGFLRVMPRSRILETVFAEMRLRTSEKERHLDVNGHFTEGFESGSLRGNGNLAFPAFSRARIVHSGLSVEGECPWTGLPLRIAINPELNAVHAVRNCRRDLPGSRNVLQTGSGRSASGGESRFCGLQHGFTRSFLRARLFLASGTSCSPVVHRELDH